MNLDAATPADIAEFQKGAQTRFQERGVDPAVADGLFSAFLTKAANDMGLLPAQPAAPVMFNKKAVMDKIAAVLDRKK